MPSHSSDAVPQMLKWAREKAGLTVESAAVALKVTQEKLLQWEVGEKSPTYGQLRKIAARYNRPLYVFYLERPRTDFTIVQDFRKLPPKMSREFSLGLHRFLRAAQEQQEWAASYRKELGQRKCGIVGSANLNQQPIDVAKKLRNDLGVTLSDQVNCDSPREAFSLWRQRCESLGVLVFQSPGVDVAEMRGCALSNGLAPVAIVNGRDFATAKSFTLIHEMAHILLGVSGISGTVGRDMTQVTNSSEEFCNRVAAETLVPEADFRSRIPADWRSKDDKIISAMAVRYHVSRVMICLRLMELGFAPLRYLNDKWASLQPKNNMPKKGGPAPHVIALARCGETFSRLAISAYHAGAIHGGELAELIRLKLNHLPQLESRLYPYRVQSVI
jgi:Zn-dependent peptidase ImmA (M78 family)/transcriptional regulator with XRE-family HTH domain